MRKKAVKYNSPSHDHPGPPAEPVQEAYMPNLTTLPIPDWQLPGGSVTRAEAEATLRKIMHPFLSLAGTAFVARGSWETYDGLMPIEDADGFGGIINVEGLRIAVKRTYDHTYFSLLYPDNDGATYGWRVDSEFWDNETFHAARAQRAYDLYWRARANRSTDEDTVAIPQTV